MNFLHRYTRAFMKAQNKKQLKSIYGVTIDDIKNIMSYVPGSRSYIHNSTLLLPEMFRNIYQNMYSNNAIENKYFKSAVYGMNKYCINSNIPIYIPLLAEQDGAVFQYHLALKIWREFASLDDALEYAGLLQESNKIKKSTLTVLKKFQDYYDELMREVYIFSRLKLADIKYVEIALAAQYESIHLVSLRQNLDFKLLSFKKHVGDIKTFKITHNIPFAPYKNFGIDHPLFRDLYYSNFRPFIEAMPDEVCLLGYGEHDINLFYQYVRLLSYITVFADIPEKKFVVGVSPFAFTDYIDGAKPMYGETHNFLTYGDLYVETINYLDDDEDDGGRRHPIIKVPPMVPALSL